MESSLFEAAALIEKDRQCIWHPFTQMQTAHAPIPISHAKGTYLYGANGSSYLDGISSWWVNLHGHAHPYIIEKLTKQVEKLEHVIFAGFTHAPAVELAFRLLEILPGKMSKIFYSDNGSTAVEIALKMALQYWHNQKIVKNKVICFKGSYHGDTFGAMSAAGKNLFNKPFWKQLFDVYTIDVPIKGHEEKALTQLETFLKQDDAACFIFEPLVLGAGGMIIYPAEGLDSLLACCKNKGVLTIADEVMTGFGRTDTLFACQALKEKPDLICLSKGLTGGFLPLGATACTEKIYAAFLGEHDTQAFLHGHSYTANPLACSSANASLDLLLKPECLSQRERIAASHKNFCRRHPKLKRCESIGTLLALEYHDLTIRNKLYHFFLSRGVLLRPLGNVLYVLPPYCIQPEELRHIYETIAFTLENDL